MRLQKNIGESSRPLVIAHRGASKAARENTLDAFEKAISMGADAIEFDVRRTKDGVFVVHHDPSIEGSSAPLSRQTLDEARDAARSAGFELPTLEQTLNLYKNRIGLDIELKEEGYEQQIVVFIQAHVSADDVVITSFNDRSISEVKSYWPKVRTGLILGVDSPASFRVRISELYPLKRLKECRADLVAVNFHLLKFGFVRRMTRASYPVWVWTVDDTELAKRLINSGVDGIITDLPDLVRKI
ncbi:MAG: glycerophosphodiester phosphodiesterase [Candidatus Zixiibacteriota bacterium]